MKQVENFLIVICCIACLLFSSGWFGGRKFKKKEISYKSLQLVLTKKNLKLTKPRLPGVAVRLFKNNEIIFDALTNSRGRFRRFKNYLEQGKYKIIIKYKDEIDYEEEFEFDKKYKFEILKPFIIEGIVSASDTYINEKIKGGKKIRITIIDKTDNFNIIGNTNSDIDGKYKCKLKNIFPDREYILQAKTEEGDYRASKEFKIEEGKERFELNINIERRETMIIDPEKEPVKGTIAQ